MMDFSHIWRLLIVIIKIWKQKVNIILLETSHLIEDWNVNFYEYIYIYNYYYTDDYTYRRSFLFLFII